MKKHLTVVQVGCGKMGKYLMRYAVENGCNLVSAFDMNPAIIGQPVSKIVEDVDVNILVEDARTFPQRLPIIKPDCVVVATKSLLKDVKDVLMTCAANGVNVVTTCDEALYPWNSSPTLTAELDETAKRNNCTITSAGFPDLSYCHLVAASAGAAHKITKITGSASYNADEYGIALAEHHGVGFTTEEFEREIAAPNRLAGTELQSLINEGEFKPIPMWNTNGWLCERLGLTVISQSQTCEPIYSDNDLASQTLGRVIPKGDVIGMRAAAKTETSEGIILETESIGKVYAPGEVDTNDWVIYGEPDIYVSNEHIKNTEMICSLMVSRIVDAVNSGSGFVTSNHFGPAKYYVKPLNEYIKNK